MALFAWIGIAITGLLAVLLAVVSTYRTGRQRGRNVAFSLVIGQTAFLGWVAVFVAVSDGMTGGLDPAAAEAVLFLGGVAIATGLVGLIAPFLVLELIGYIVERARGEQLIEPEETRQIWLPFCGGALTIWSTWATWELGLIWLLLLPPTTLGAFVLAFTYDRRRPSVWRKLLIPLTLVPVAMMAWTAAKEFWTTRRTETYRAEVIFKEPRPKFSWNGVRRPTEDVPVVWLDYVDCPSKHLVMPLRPDAPPNTFSRCVANLEVGEIVPVRVRVTTKPLDPDGILSTRFAGIEAVGDCEVPGGSAEYESHSDFLAVRYPHCARKEQ